MVVDRDLVQAYLPADQGQLLIKAAITVMVVQTECMGIVNSRDSKSKKPGSLSPSTTCENLNLLQRESRKVRLLDQNTMADPAGTLMSGVGTEVLKSNLQDIDINKLQRQVFLRKNCSNFCHCDCCETLCRRARGCSTIWTTMTTSRLP